MATPLYTRHSAGLAATYAEVENHALHQDAPFAGTPGAVSVRTNAGGSRFYVRQYYDHEGRKKDQYIASPAGSVAAERLAQAWKGRIEEANGILKSVRLLAREGYATLPPKHLAALVPIAKHGIFLAGAQMVGTHAFEVIANRMGIRASAFATEDVDLARPHKLALEEPPDGGLLAMLRESGIDFVEVPGFSKAEPTTSYKERGRSRFTFDLLVPTSGQEIEFRPVPELKAHATALPCLRYLLGDSQTGAAISSRGVVAVRIPVPERFALHKLIVAQIRKGRPEKSLKDLKQAAILIAALGELHPGALEEAYAGTPSSSRKHIRKSLMLIMDQLGPHPRSREEIAVAAKP